jgi:predicted aspartyl protease
MASTRLAAAAAGVAASLLAWLPASHACELRPVARMPLTVFMGVPVVSVELDGHAMPFLLDTGAQVTVISPENASQAGLPPDPAWKSRIWGVVPNQETAWNFDARYKSLVVGGLDTGGGHIRVARFGSPEVARHLSGILGADVLAKHDLEIDIPHGIATLYDPQGCIGDFVPWTAAHDRVEHAWTDARQTQLTIPARIGEVPVRTFVDTGASATMVTRSAAIAAGEDDSAMTAGPSRIAHDATGRVIVGREHAFQSIQVGAETFDGATVMVCDCSIPDADMQIGEDFLKIRKIWLSYSTGQIFVTRANAP